MRLRRLAGEIACLVLAASLCGACASIATVTVGYEPAPAAASTRMDRSLAVVPFEDARPPRKYDSPTRLFMVYIPLLPWVANEYERLDETVQLLGKELESGGRGVSAAARQHAPPPFEQYAYPRSFASAIASDLAASGAFREVAFVEAAEAPRFDFVLGGRLRESPMRQSTTSYLLGVPGVLLWMLPIPNQRISTHVSLDLELRKAGASEPVWRKTIEPSVWRLLTLYHPALLYGRKGTFGFNTFSPPSGAQVDRDSVFAWHFEALRRGMEETRPELIRTIEAQAVREQAPRSPVALRAER